MQVTFTPTPDEDTAAAAIAAIACASAQETAGDEPNVPARSAWHVGGALTVQGIPPARNGLFAAWHAAERARRAKRWSSGIVGL